MSRSAALQPVNPFQWQVPPFCRLEPAAAAQGDQPVDVELLNGEQLQGELLSLDSESGSLWLASGRGQGSIRTIALDSVRCIRLQLPLELIADQETLDAIGHSAEDAEAERSFILRYIDGKTVGGQTRSFLKTQDGLFLFPLDGKDGAIRSWFVPRGQVGELQIGPRLGQMLEDKGLVDHTVMTKALDRQAHQRKERLGEYLTERAIVTPQELTRALRDQRRRPSKRLGELLLENGLITTAELERALSLQSANRDQKLGQILVSMGVVTLRTIQRTLAEKLGIPYVNVHDFQIEQDALELVNSRVATQHQVLPLVRSDRALIVAVDNPLDFEFEDELQFIANRKVIAVIGDPQEIHERIAAEYGDWGEFAGQPLDAAPSLAHTDIEELTSRLAKETRWAPEPEDNRETEVRVTDNTLVRLVNKIIVDAHQQRASDIHIESTRGQSTRVRFRIDGVLQNYLELKPIYRQSLVSRIKVMSNLDISEHRLAQDGKINFSRFAPLPLQLRVAIVPTTDGAEDVVLRLLGTSEPLPLDQLDLGEDYLAQLQQMIQRSHGLILVCGPTGSGKTTTLHSVLHHINSPERKIWTAEDPIEINQAGLRQVQVNARIGWTFAKAMRAFLRADPDVIMVGEMRDVETTNIGIEASLTGHLVFSTLHTNSAAESVVRLLEMGMDPFNFSDALIGILSQRLARRLCKECKTPRALDAEELEALAAEYCAGTEHQPGEVITGWRQAHWNGKGNPQVFEATGCSRCDAGYHGRIGVFELLSASPEVKQLIRSQGTVPQIQQAAIRAGMRLLRQDALDKVLRGLIDLDWARAVSS